MESSSFHNARNKRSRSVEAEVRVNEQQARVPLNVGQRWHIVTSVFVDVSLSHHSFNNTDRNLHGDIYDDFYEPFAEAFFVGERCPYRRDIGRVVGVSHTVV